MLVVYIVIGLILANFIHLFYSIEIPPDVIVALQGFFAYIWNLEGILPINAIMVSLKLDFGIIMALIIFRLIFSTVGGKPEI